MEEEDAVEVGIAVRQWFAAGAARDGEVEGEEEVDGAVRQWLAELQHTATHCNTTQHTATHCNALQRASTMDGAVQRWLAELSLTDCAEAFCAERVLDCATLSVCSHAQLEALGVVRLGDR